MLEPILAGATPERSRHPSNDGYETQKRQNVKWTEAAKQALDHEGCAVQAQHAARVYRSKETVTRAALLHDNDDATGRQGDDSQCNMSETHEIHTVSTRSALVSFGCRTPSTIESPGGMRAMQLPMRMT